MELTAGGRPTESFERFLTSIRRPDMSREEAHLLLEGEESLPAYVEDQLVRHYLPSMGRIAWKLAREWKKTALFDCFLSAGNDALVRGIRAYRPGTGAELSTYLYRCLSNAYINVLRGEGRRTEREGIWARARESSDGFPIVKTVLTHALGKDLLSEEERIVVEARVFKDQTFGVIARIHGQSESTWRNRFRSGEEKLVAYWEGLMADSLLSSPDRHSSRGKRPVCTRKF